MAGFIFDPVSIKLSTGILKNKHMWEEVQRHLTNRLLLPLKKYPQSSPL